MADSFIQVAPDSTGKKMQTYGNVISGNVVEAEAVVLVDSTGSPIGKQRTPGATVVAVDGSVAAGARTVQLVPSADFSGTLLGQAWPSGTAIVGWTAQGNDTIGAIAYTVTTGTLLILTLT